MPTAPFIRYNSEFILVTKVCDQLIELISITEMQIVSPLWHDMEF